VFHLDEHFFARSWRREPVLLQGAARHLVADAPTPTQIMGYTSGARSPGRGQLPQRDWFFQGMTQQVPFADRVVREARAAFEWNEMSCDLVYEKGPAPVACHDDNDDQFTIQLSGAKRWRFSPPDSHAADGILDDVRRRVFGEPQARVASARLGMREFAIEPGDVLYVPPLWMRWGESLGESTSAILVIHAASAFTTLREALLMMLRRSPDGFIPPSSGRGR